MAKNRKTENLNRQIDENLRRVYSDAVNEPLPDRFAELLKQLRDAEDETEDSKQSSEPRK